jgi:hypothetical protein
MCCTFTASEMSDTRLYAGEAEKNGETVHVLAYQNTAQTSTPNAMVLPIPTNTKLGVDNLIDTREFKGFLKDITNATREYTKGFSGRRGMTLGAAFNDSDAEVVDVGSYTVVLADNVSQIPEALTRVPERKRPTVSTQFLLGYGKLYPKQPIVVCCWDGSIEAEPLLMWYVPRDRTTLFIPTMDAHDGKAPNLEEKVYTDHIISVGSVGPDTDRPVRYTTGKIPVAVAGLLPTHVHGHRLPDWLRNGDCFVKTAALHQHDKKDYYMGGTNVELERGFNGKVFYSSKMNGWT